MEDDLFNATQDDPKTPPKAPEKAETFTVGDKEYTQDQLNDLVSKGNQYNDIETRFNTKLDKVVPDYTRSTQETADLKRKLEALEKADFDAKQTAGTLSREELIAKAKQEAAGIGLMTDENTPALIDRAIEKYELQKTLEAQTKDLETKGIKADASVIKRYMEAANLDNVPDAVSQLYGAQVKMWQDAELEKTKPEGVYAKAGAGTGFKLPADVKVTEDNLMELFKQSIGGTD